MEERKDPAGQHSDSVSTNRRLLSELLFDAGADSPDISPDMNRAGYSAGRGVLSSPHLTTKSEGDIEHRILTQVCLDSLELIPVSH